MHGRLSSLATPISVAGGESLGEFSRRVVEFIEDISTNMTAVDSDRHAWWRAGHGYHRATGMPLSAIRDFPIYNASVN